MKGKHGSPSPRSRDAGNNSCTTLLQGITEMGTARAMKSLRKCRCMNSRRTSPRSRRKGTNVDRRTSNSFMRVKLSDSKEREYAAPKHRKRRTTTKFSKLSINSHSQNIGIRACTSDRNVHNHVLMRGRKIHVVCGAENNIPKAITRGP
jgi:hypothetical protein